MKPIGHYDFLLTLVGLCYAKRTIYVWPIKMAQSFQSIVLVEIVTFFNCYYVTTKH